MLFSQIKAQSGSQRCSFLQKKEVHCSALRNGHAPVEWMIFTLPLRINWHQVAHVRACWHLMLRKEGIRVASLAAAHLVNDPLTSESHVTSFQRQLPLGKIKPWTTFIQLLFDVLVFTHSYFTFPVLYLCPHLFALHCNCATNSSELLQHFRCHSRLCWLQPTSSAVFFF